MTRNITQIGKLQPEYQESKIKGDYIIDFSKGVFALNMNELLDKMEIWVKEEL